MSDKTDEELKPNTDPADVAGEAGRDSSAASAPAGATDATAEEEREGGMGPAILAGVGILAVVAALVFWPAGDDKDGKGKDGADGKTAAADAQGRAGADEKGGASAKGPGGVAARNADDPSRVGKDGEPTEVEFKMNPAVRLPRGIGMAPGVPPEEPPPKFDTKEEEIEWWEAKLDRAHTQLEMRKKATERLAKWKEKAEQSDNPAEQLAQYDQRAEVVNENYRKAQAKVAELEKKIAELKGE